MNKQKKDGNISWTDYTWNPIKGLCPVGCFYCYARAMYKRFKLDEDLRLHLVERLAPRFIKKPAKIFVCSTIEIFHPRISAKWRDMIFSIIEQCPQHIFQILTKMPENIDRPMPDNVWLGVSVTNRNDVTAKIPLLFGADAKIRFISVEPILEETFLGGLYYDYLLDLDWVVIGKLTGHGKKHDPEREWISEIVDEAKRNKTPIFLKENLKEIWKDKLIQEYPT